MQSRAGMMTCDMARASPDVNFCAVGWRGIVNDLWGEEVGRATSRLKSSLRVLSQFRETKVNELDCVVKGIVGIV
jgi:hypothetical protein